MTNPRGDEFAKIDSENRYLWKMNPLRLEAEVIRDSILAVSGELKPAAGGPGFFPVIDGELLKRAGTWWHPSPEEERKRRSVYMLQKRSIVHPMVNVFDGANVNESCAARDVTTVTPQVFALFNNDFVHEQSQALAKRILGEVGSDPEIQIERVFSLSLQREPSELERSKGRAFLETGTLAELCLVVFNTNEFIFLE